jgi:hypothetical protein
MVKFSDLQAYDLRDSNRKFVIHFDEHVHVFHPIKTVCYNNCLQVNNLSVAFCVTAKRNL